MYLKIQPYKQFTLSNQNFFKLSAKYYGPYHVLQKVEAYKLLLPSHIAIHPTFHESQLKLCYNVLKPFNHPPVVDLLC